MASFAGSNLYVFRLGTGHLALAHNHPAEKQTEVLLWLAELGSLASLRSLFSLHRLELSETFLALCLPLEGFWRPLEVARNEARA